MRKLITTFVCVCALLFHANAQNRTIKGKVADASNNPIANASVVVTGSNSGTTTDANGNFSLSVPANAKSITITSLNFANQQISISGKSTVSVTLAENTKDLQEVVVVGYSSAK
ncbi:MAG: hypothetical protein FGM61_03070 [Sediminibacterium sp.]|nr:hypothetical protein [Sediminibacterium sp.]